MIQFRKFKNFLRKDKMPRYKVIHTEAINVHCTKRQTGEEFEAEPRGEIKTLLKHKYIEKVKK